MNDDEIDIIVSILKFSKTYDRNTTKDFTVIG